MNERHFLGPFLGQRPLPADRWTPWPESQGNDDRFLHDSLRNQSMTDFLFSPPDTRDAEYVGGFVNNNPIGLSRSAHETDQLLGATVGSTVGALPGIIGGGLSVLVPGMQIKGPIIGGTAAVAGGAALGHLGGKYGLAGGMYKMGKELHPVDRMWIETYR